MDDPENDSKEEKHYKEVLSQLFDSDIPDSVFLPPLVRPPPPLYSDSDDLVWLCPNDNGMPLSYTLLNIKPGAWVTTNIWIISWQPIISLYNIHKYGWSCFIVYEPESLDFAIIWIISEYSFAWEPHIFTDKDKPEDTKKLFILAQRQALESSQYDLLKQELYDKEDCLQSLPLSPSTLPKLVDKNPSLAVDILLLLAQTQQFADYLTVLLNMDLSLHSMEVCFCNKAR